MINDSNAIYIQILNYMHHLTTLMAQTRKKFSATNTTKNANKTRKRTQDIVPLMLTSEPVTTIPGPSTSASEPRPALGDATVTIPLTSTSEPVTTVPSTLAVTQHPALGDVTTAVNNKDLSCFNDLKGM